MLTRLFHDKHLLNTVLSFLLSLYLNYYTKNVKINDYYNNGGATQPTSQRQEQRNLCLKRKNA